MKSPRRSSPRRETSYIKFLKQYAQRENLGRNWMKDAAEEWNSMKLRGGNTFFSLDPKDKEFYEVGKALKDPKNLINDFIRLNLTEEAQYHWNEELRLMSEKDPILFSQTIKYCKNPSILTTNVRYYVDLGKCVHYKKLFDELKLETEKIVFDNTYNNSERRQYRDNQNKNYISRHNRIVNELHQSLNYFPGPEEYEKLSDSEFEDYVKKLKERESYLLAKGNIRNSFLGRRMIPERKKAELQKLLSSDVLGKKEKDYLESEITKLESELSQIEAEKEIHRKRKLEEFLGPAKFYPKSNISLQQAKYELENKKRDEGPVRYVYRHQDIYGS